MANDPSTGGYPATERTTPTRHGDRARYDAQAIHALLAEVLTCHVGYVVDGEPVVIPTIHTPLGENLYLHSSSGSRLARLAAAPGGTPVCVTVTALDGLVLARSQFNHSMNYRSVVVRGIGVAVTDQQEKRDALAAVVEHVAAGRSTHSRPPTPRELAATTVIRVPIEQASMKARNGPPADDHDDLTLPHWAGVISVRTAYGPAFPSPDLPYDVPVPHGLANYHRGARPQDYR
jgi:nitroimidazol reductase NimA-like FMN-containing flavoprotein (pyridoxamine 5'-phosphate oxidase superfamily)